MAQDASRTQAWIAARVGVTQQNVSVWLSGRCRPSVIVRMKLERLAGIPLDAWLTLEEREELAAAGAASPRPRMTFS